MLTVTENAQDDAGEFLGWLFEALKIGPHGFHGFPRDLAAARDGFEILEHAAKDIQVGIVTTGTCIAPGCTSSTRNIELSDELILSFGDVEKETTLDVIWSARLGIQRCGLSIAEKTWSTPGPRAQSD